MTVTYGNTPGTQVTIEGGSVQGIQVGAEEKVVIFANGDPSVGSHSSNDPRQVESLTEVENQFGPGSDVAEVFADTRANGANVEGGYVYVVVPTQTTVSNEAFTSVQSFTLANAPIVEDLSLITVTDTAAATDLTVEFRYQSPPPTPTNSDTAFINPYTGEVETDNSTDYEVDYDYLDWQGALDSADGVVQEDESATYIVNSPAESVASDALVKAENLRDPNYKMVKVVAGAEPNADSSESPPDPIYDLNAYSDGLDSLPGFAVVPCVQNDSTLTNLGAVAGRVAGNALTNPVRGENLRDVTVETGKNNEGRLTFAERQTARDKQLIPLRGGENPSMDGSLSTDTNETWETDIQTVRVIDRVVIIIKQIADAFLNKLDLSNRDELAAQAAQSELENLADDGLLVGNTPNETNLYVQPASSSQGEIALEAGITPVQAVETFDVEVTVA